MHIMHSIFSQTEKATMHGLCHKIYYFPVHSFALFLNMFQLDNNFVQVASVDLDEVLSQGAYMLLYSR